MAVRFIVESTEGGGEPLVYSFAEDQVRFVIGRDPAATDVTLSDEERNVGRKHAEIFLESGAYHLKDLWSKNFTFVGDIRLDPDEPHLLRSGDTFSIGTFRIRFEIEETIPDQDPTRIRKAYINPLSTPLAAVVVALGELEEAYHALSDEWQEIFLAEALEGLVGEMSVDWLRAWLSGMQPERPAEETRGAP